MSALRAILEELVTSSTSERDKGDKFERLCVAFFQTDATYAQQFSDVWMWGDWDGNGGRPDTGIDLVAKNRDDDGFTAIQCKFYADTTVLSKDDIDSFFNESGKAPFTRRIVVSTTNNWSTHAEKSLIGQDKPTARIGVEAMEASSIDWASWTPEHLDTLQRKTRKKPRVHQEQAIEAVLNGFEEHERGKLIMACGTGKTYTGQLIAERLVGAGGSVLVLVPSISLLSQTLKEWASDSTVKLAPFAVCSDTKAGSRRKTEDISPYDLVLPATTDPELLVSQFGRLSDEETMTVIFSTYQSVPVITAAQEAGVGVFDLVICDEAHRTTGVTLADEDDSNFTRVHDDTYVNAAKRLYMTATPRVYSDGSKARASAEDSFVASMDDESVYGPEFHRIGFREAVDRDLLTDYKVLVLVVDEEAVATAFQQQLSDENNELVLNDATRIVGCLNALSKRKVLAADKGEAQPMKRAVAFSNTIAESKKFQGLFGEVADRYRQHELDVSDFDVDVLHVDGSYNALQREELIRWLKEDPGEDACRILSNARCLTEGVDVPALDAICFLEPRKSMVDVIQAVGRVMRKSKDKDMGYVILPIGIPAGTSPEQALADNQRFRVVWQVLNALRSHDERMNSVVNKLDLNQQKPEIIDVIPVPGDTEDEEETGPSQLELTFPVGELREALYATMVKKVGTSHYWEDWANDIAQIASRHEARILALLGDSKLGVASEFETFLAGLRTNLNDSISTEDAVGMLSQHLITRPVFEALFEDFDFLASNPVSQTMQRMVDVLDEHAIEQETEQLQKFYNSVRLRAEGVDNAEGKQRIIIELYDRFFRKALPKQADSLGIVYTPQEIVDFTVALTGDVLAEHFDGATFGDKGVHVLDPFTGTGTFIVRLLQSGRISPHNLARKYAEELHANEILLLAYYIAAINIAAAFHDLNTEDSSYTPFEGMVLTDTFQLGESGDGSGQFDVFPVNNRRAERQKQLDIRVILGNPPYSAGQSSQSDNNQNLKYEALDRALAGTYVKLGTSTSKNKLYDSYLRAFRWASDRVISGAQGGVVAFVSNNSYLDSNMADGVRLSLGQEYHHIYVVNLRGNQKAGDWRAEGGKVFGSGSQAGIAVTVLVRTAGDLPATGATIHYCQVEDGMDAAAKLRWLQEESQNEQRSVDWTQVTPNAFGDWLTQRSSDLEELVRIHDDSLVSVFRERTSGLLTARDTWNHAFTTESLASQAKELVRQFNSESDRISRVVAAEPPRKAPELKKRGRELASEHESKIGWFDEEYSRLARGERYELDADFFRVCLYRPFSKRLVNSNPRQNSRVYKLHRVYPNPELRTLSICIVPHTSSKPFSTLMVDEIPSYAIWGSEISFFLPLTLSSEANGEHLLDLGSQSNLDPASFAELNVPDDASHEDVFFAVYAIFHHPDYKESQEANLKRELPRIPAFVDSTQFETLASAGRRLSDLHVGYESIEPWSELEIVTAHDSPSLRIEKLSYVKVRNEEGKRVDDKTTIIYNSDITIQNLPLRAQDYQLGTRSALDWIVREYKVKTDSKSQITSDPNDWCDEVDDPRYILDLIGRVTAVSMRTLDIVESLPDLALD